MVTGNEYIFDNIDETFNFVIGLLKEYQSRVAFRTNRKQIYSLPGHLRIKR